PDSPAPYENFPTLPVPLEPLSAVAVELLRQPDADPFRLQVFQQPLSQEIGYSVVGRGTVGLIFGALLLVTLIGLVSLSPDVRFSLSSLTRPELLGWLGPAAALAATVIFVALGESSRR